MRIFVPHNTYKSTAVILHEMHLAKGVRDSLRILEVLSGQHRNLVNHPAVVMWRGSELKLYAYAATLGAELFDRSRLVPEDAIKSARLVADAMITSKWTPADNNKMPWWHGNEGLMATHRSELLRLNPEHYRQFWPYDPDDLPYAWPGERPPKE